MINFDLSTYLEMMQFSEKIIKIGRF